MVRLAWGFPVLFFLFISSGFFPALPPETSLLQRAVPLLLNGGMGILAWYLFRKHYPHVKERMVSYLALLFIPITLAYGFLFELSFNFERFIREAGQNALWEHMQYHLINDMAVLLLMFFCAWMFLRKKEAGRITVVFSLALGTAVHMGLTSFVNNSDPSQVTLGGAFLGGMIWTWFMHSTWMLTSLLFRKK